MLPESTWWRGNPHYDHLWKTVTARERLQLQVLEAILSVLPESAGSALLAELVAAKHPGQVQALRVAELTQPAIDVVLAAVAQQAWTYRLKGQEVQLVPLQHLQGLTASDLKHQMEDHDEQHSDA